MKILLKHGILILAFIIIVPSMGWAEQNGNQIEDLPLKPTRTLNFTTDEGTWISIDVSPDGQNLVFDLLGDLYILPIEGGEAKALTRGMAFDSQPRFSPDGRSIALVSDRDGSENIWIINADGSSPKQLTSGKDTVFISPEWTPDGEAIITGKTGVVRGSLVELWLYYLADKKGVCLVNGEKHGLTALGPAFGPNPRFLFFSQKAASLKNWCPQIGEYQLAVYDRETQDIYPYSNAQGGGMRPLLSPDGRWLVYASRFHQDTGLKLRDLHSGEEKWLVYPGQLDAQEAQHASWDLMPGSSFTPDSKFLMTTIEGKIWKVGVPDGKRTLIPFTARVEQPLAPAVRSELRIDDRPVRARRISDPAISPDGKKVVFSALGRLYIMELPDGAPQRLTNSDTGEFQPSWSPDGQYIVYATWKNMKEGGHLFRINSSGEGKPERLTQEAAYYGYPTYSPDGERIVFVSMSRQAWIEDLLSYGSDMTPRAGRRVQLGWIPAKGGDIRRITLLHDLGRPHFIMSDRERIFIYQNPGQTMTSRLGLISVCFDGSDLRSHLKAYVFSEKWPVDQILIAPGGNRVLIQADRHVYLVDLPGLLEEPLIVCVSSPDSTYIVRKISTVGGEFASWSCDGNEIFFSLGASLFQYNLNLGKLQEKRIRVEMPRYIPKGTLVLKGGRAITMRGDEVIPSCDLVIKGNRIVGLGPCGSVAIPPGAHIINISGKIVLPGFIDVHNHQGTTQETRIIQPWEFISSLAYGVTTGYDTGAAGPSLVTYADMIETGQLVGPRFYGAGALILPALVEKLKSLNDARDLIRRYYDAYGLEGVKQYACGGRRKRQLLAMAAKEFGLPIHAEGNGENKPGVTEIIDGYTTHQHYFTIPFYRDIVELMTQSGIGYVPTLLITHGAQGAEDFYYAYAEEPVTDNPKLRLFTPHPFLDRETRRREEPWQRWMVKEEYIFPRLAKSAGDMLRAGGKVGVGAHGQRQGIGFHWEMWSLATGMSNHDVLRAATLMGTEICGLDRDLGSLEIGKLADIVVLDKDPLENIRNTTSIRYVIKNGVVYKGDTLTEIWPQYRERSWLEGWYTDPQK